MVGRRSLLAGLAALLWTRVAGAAPGPRLAVLDWGLAETCLALGCVPVGVPAPAWYDRYAVEPPMPPGVADVGLLFTPNFEVLQDLALDAVVIPPLLTMSRDRIQFEGRSLAAWPARELARRIAYLPQQVAAADGMLVHELVALGRYPWHGALGRFGAEDRGLVTTAMDLTGVADFSGRLVDTLSGGERQRAWLAMLMAQNARALLLDEPISALDVRHQVEIMALVQRLSHDRGLSVVVVLHDVNIAACFCDEIVALHLGQVIAQGPPAAIVTPDVLRRIYGLQFGVMPHPITGLPLSYLP
jgi:iron-chelate-transporting ATPase